MSWIAQSEQCLVAIGEISISSTSRGISLLSHFHNSSRAHSAPYPMAEGVILHDKGTKSVKLNTHLKVMLKLRM